MKDEIKEILSLLNSSSWSNEAKQIEDYITNLRALLFKKEEDIERLEDTISKIKKYCRKNKIIDKSELQCIIRVDEVERQCDKIKDLGLQGDDK